MNRDDFWSRMFRTNHWTIPGTNVRNGQMMGGRGDNPSAGVSTRNAHPRSTISATVTEAIIALIAGRVAVARAGLGFGVIHAEMEDEGIRYVARYNPSAGRLETFATQNGKLAHVEILGEKAVHPITWVPFLVSLYLQDDPEVEPLLPQLRRQFEAGETLDQDALFVLNGLLYGIRHEYAHEFLLVTPTMIQLQSDVTDYFTSKKPDFEWAQTAPLSDEQRLAWNTAEDTLRNLEALRRFGATSDPALERLVRQMTAEQAQDLLLHLFYNHDI